MAERKGASNYLSVCDTEVWIAARITETHKDEEKCPQMLKHHFETRHSTETEQTLKGNRKMCSFSGCESVSFGQIAFCMNGTRTKEMDSRGHSRGLQHETAQQWPRTESFWVRVTLYSYDVPMLKNTGKLTGLYSTSLSDRLLCA